MANGVEGAPARPGALKDRVYLPATPVTARPLKAAWPFASVVAAWLVRVPLGPEETEAVTTMPGCAVGFPFSSTVCSTGCCAKAAPLWVGEEGWLEILSRPATPARAVAVNRTGGTAEVSTRAVSVY